MRQGDHIVESHQVFRSALRRFGGLTVQTGTGEVAGRESIDQCIFVYEPTPGRVQEPTARLHGAEKSCIDDVRTLIGEG